jgi:phage-related minor tail protein
MDIAALGLKVDSTPVDKANQSLDNLAAQGAKVEQSAQRMGSAFTRSTQQIQGQVDRMLAQMQAMVAQQEKTNKLLADYGTTAQRTTQITSAARTAADAHTSSLQKQSDALHGAAKGSQALGDATALTAQQIQGLTHSVRGVIDMIAAGQSPIKALAIETSRLSGTFGGIGAVFSAVKNVISPMVVGIGLGVTAVGALALAYKQGSAEADAYTRAVVLSGNAAGTGAAQMQAMADRISKIVGTQGQAAEVLAMMASTGKVASDQLETYAQLAIRLDRVGVAAKDTVADLAALGNDPVSAALKLNDSINFLTTSVYRHIKALQDAGQLEEAGEAAQRAYAGAMDARAARLEEQQGSIERGWQHIKDAAKSAWDAMLGIGRPDTIADLQAKIDQIQGNARGAQRTANPTLSPSDAAAVKALQDQMAALREKAKFDQQSAQYQQEQEQSTKAASAFEVLREQSLSRQQRLQLQITQAQNEGVKAGYSQAEIDKVIAGLSADLAKLGTEAQIERLQGVQQVVEVRTKSMIADLDAQLKTGAINQRTYIEQTAQAELAAMDSQRNVLQQQIALKSKERDSEKEVASLKVQMLVLDAQRAARQQQLNRDLQTYVELQDKAIRAVVASEYQDALDAKAKAITDAANATNAAQASMNAYKKSIDDANKEVDFQLTLLGKTTDEQARLNAQHQIELKLQEQIKDIQNRGLSADEQAQDIANVTKKAQEAIDKIDLSQYVQKWQHVNQEVGDSLYDALTGQGQSAAQKLKEIFGDLVLRPLLQPIATSITNFIMGGAPGSAGLFSSGSNTFSGMFTSGSIGNFLGASATGVPANPYLGSTAALGTLGEAVPYIGALYAASQGQYGSAAGMAIGTAILPGIGTIVGGLIGSMFDGKGGGPKQDGVFGRLDSGIGQGQRSAASDAAAKTSAQSIQATYDAIVKAYGGSGGLQYGLGFSMDPKGTSPSFVDITASRGNSTAYTDLNLNAGRSQQELQDAVTAMTSKAVLAGLQQSGIQGAIGQYLQSLGSIAKLSADDATAALNRVQTAMTQKQQLEDQIFQMTASADDQLAKQRQDELAAIDDTNKALQQRVFALQDEQKASATLSQALADAKNSAAQWATFIAGINNSIRGYIDKLNGTSAGGLPPEQQLANANSQFQQQLGLARLGDRTALQNITNYADQLIQAQQGYTGSGADTAKTIASVKGSLAGLPQVQSDSQYLATTISQASASEIAAFNAASNMQISVITDASGKQIAQYVDSTGKLVQVQLQGSDDVSAAMKAAGDKIWDGLWGSSGMLAQNFQSLDTNVDGLLDFSELKTALGPLATDDTISALIKRVDTNGDGMISKQEATNAALAESAALQAQATLDAAKVVSTAVTATAAAPSSAPFSKDFWAALSQSSSSHSGITFDASGKPTITFNPGGENTFADGGDFMGGYRLVGELGPELEATGPSRIFNAQQTRQILGGGSDPALLAEVRALRAEVQALRATQQKGNEIAAAGARGTIAPLEEIRENTAGSTRKARLDSLRRVRA